MGMLTALQGYGRFVLAASDATQFAWEGDKVIGETQSSLFTHFLVKGLEGEADGNGDGRITVDELYDYAFEQISRLTPKQTPTKYTSKQEGEIVLRDIMRIDDIKPVPLPDDLLTEIDDLRPYIREAAVQKLKKIVKGKNIGLAHSATQALEKIAADDNTTRRVAQMADAILGSVRQAEQRAEEEGSAREEAQRLAREKTQAERKAKEEAEILLPAQAERKAVESEAARLMAEREAAEKVAREVALKAVQEEAARRAEQGTLELASRRKAEQEVAAKAERDAVRPAIPRNPESKAAEKRKESSNAHARKSKPGAKRSKKLETSVAYPKLLSKRFASSFLLQYYLPEQRPVATRNVRAAFDNPKISEYQQPSSVKLGQKVIVKFFSHAFDFSEPVTKTMDQEVNVLRFLGKPKDNCEPGSHKILISVADAATGKELESMTITAQVVDFAFDHISRPLLSRISATVLGIGSLVMFLLGLLEQIDKTAGLTSGAAAGFLAVLVYGNFYNLYQRMRPNAP
jgi:hypothetical protein